MLYGDLTATLGKHASGICSAKPRLGIHGCARTAARPGNTLVDRTPSVAAERHPSRNGQPTRAEVRYDPTLTAVAVSDVRPRVAATI
jgi:hypothetical protein